MAHTLPNEGAFQLLHQTAQANDKGQVVLIDRATDQRATMPQLLAAAATFKHHLYTSLPQATRADLDGGKQVWFLLGLPSGYAFTVAVLAVLALGGGLAPISTSVVEEELTYFVQKTDAACLICFSDLHTVANGAVKAAVESEEQPWTCPPPVIVQADHLRAHDAVVAEEYSLSDSYSINPDNSFVSIFTSGTTGKPKGVCHSRRRFLGFLRESMAWFGGSKGETAIHGGPPFWFASFSYILPCIMSGACIDFCMSVNTPSWWWHRVQEPGTYTASGSPRTYGQLLEYWAEQNGAVLKDIKPGSALEAKLQKEAANIARLHCGGTPMAMHVMDLWTRALPNGVFKDAIGSTELGGIATSLYREKMEHGGSRQYMGTLRYQLVGKTDAEGQLLLKGPYIFTHYLKDPERTAAAFDEEGYLLTGDAAELVDINGEQHLWMHGRFGFDVIRFAGWRVFAPEVESALDGLAYVRKSMVLPVKDLYVGQRVAAVIECTAAQKEQGISLAQVRSDLSASFEAYKLPTLLVVTDRPLPMGKTFKPSKKDARDLYFGADEEYSGKGDVQVWDLDSKPEQDVEKGAARKAWDWAGIGRA